MPNQNLNDSGASPGGWLGAAFRRGRGIQEEAASEVLPRTSHTSALRGVAAICQNRLKKARGLTAERVGEGQYRVWEAEPEGNRQWYHLVFGAEQGPVTPEDTVQYVDLLDPQIDKCHCQDFLFRSEDLATPCKHLLAALLAYGDEGIKTLVVEQERRERIACALQDHGG